MHQTAEIFNHQSVATKPPIMIGPVAIKGKAILAPMSGVTDRPFRKFAHATGAPLVISEMVASESLMKEDEDTLRRAVGHNISPFVIQLAGRKAYWMGEAAKRAENLGADIIDINMGCPAKQVTKGLSGSALMRNLDHALSLIEAVVKSVKVPVTLKMRLGWDQKTINAPELASRAESAGVQAFTVHGRTRQQFYKGHANWDTVKQVKKAVTKPVFVNGDILNLETAQQALQQSTADGVMIGRGAYGAPWIPAKLAASLDGQSQSNQPKLKDIKSLILEHYEDILSHYGKEVGQRSARKHLAWYVDRFEKDQSLAKVWRAKLCQSDNVSDVKQHLHEFLSERVLPLQ